MGTDTTVYHTARQSLTNDNTVVRSSDKSAVSQLLRYIDQLTEDEQDKFEEPLTVRESRHFLAKYNPQMSRLYQRHGLKSTVEEIYDCEPFQNDMQVIVGIYKLEERLKDIIVWGVVSKQAVLKELVGDAEERQPERRRRSSILPSVTTKRRSTSVSTLTSSSSGSPSVRSFWPVESELSIASSRSSISSATVTRLSRTPTLVAQGSDSTISLSPAFSQASTVIGSQEEKFLDTPSFSSFYSDNVGQLPTIPHNVNESTTRHEQPHSYLHQNYLRQVHRRSLSPGEDYGLPSPLPMTSSEPSTATFASYSSSSDDDGDEQHRMTIQSTASAFRAPAATRAGKTSIEFARENEIFEYDHDEAVKTRVEQSVIKMAKPARSPHRRALFKRFLTGSKTSNTHSDVKSSLATVV